jgi:hypothetical protein
LVRGTCAQGSPAAILAKQEASSGTFAAGQDEPPPAAEPAVLIRLSAGPAVVPEPMGAALHSATGWAVQLLPSQVRERVSQPQ